MPRTTVDPDSKPMTKAERARFCHEGCRNARRADIAVGLVYPPWKLDGELVTHAVACTRLHLCHYCEKDLRR